jgi:hypothetical protein
VSSGEAKVTLTVDGEENVARAFGDAANKANALESELNDLAKAGARVGDSQKKLVTGTQSVASQFSKFQSSIGIAGQALSQFSPLAGRVTSVLGQTTGAASSLGAAFGPIGVAAGAAVGGVAAASAAFVTLRDELKKSREEQNKFVAAFNDGFGAGGTFDHTMAHFRESIEDLFGVRGGWATLLEETEDAIRTFGVVVRVTIDDQIQILNAFILTLGGVAEALADGDFASAQAILSAGAGAYGSVTGTQGARMLGAIGVAEREDMLRDFLGSRNGNKPPPGRGGGGRGGRGRAAADLIAESNRDVYGGSARGRGDINFSSGATEYERFDIVDTRAQDAAFANDAFQKRADFMEAESDRLEKLSKSWGEYAALVGGTLVDSFEEAIKGQKNLGKAVASGFKDMLSGLAKTEVVKGIATLAEALGATILNPVAAGALYASSAQHFAAAAAAGAGAAAFGAVGGGGSRARAASSAPSRDMSTGGSDSGGGRTIVVNFNGTSILGQTYADAGLLAKRAIETAESRYG